MANRKLSWNALKEICSAAGVIIVDNDVSVFAEVLEDKIGLNTFEEELYCLLMDKANAEVEANGSSVWVTSHTGEEIQLSVYRPWVVSDDATLQ